MDPKERSTQFVVQHELENTRRREEKLQLGFFSNFAIAVQNRIQQSYRRPTRPPWPIISLPSLRHTLLWSGRVLTLHFLFLAPPRFFFTLPTRLISNMASIWSGIGSTLGKQFAKRDAIPFLGGAIGAFLLLPKFAYDESNYAVSP